MKNFIFLSFLLLFVNIYSQEEKASIEDFVTEHQGLEENDSGEITPINDREINKKIRFFIEERVVNVEFTRNIIWDNYQTFISPYDRYHYHTFIVQVKVHRNSEVEIFHIKFGFLKIYMISLYEIQLF